MVRKDSQLRFWLIAFAFFIGLVWLLKSVLIPFIAGMLIAYFLNPVVNHLAKHKIPRWLGALSVLACFGVLITLLILLIVPMLQNQIGALLNVIPSYIEKIREHYIPWMESWLSRFEPEDVNKLKDAAGQSVSEATGWMGNVVKHIISSGVALIDVLALMIITPVVAFYILNDWPRVTRAIDQLFPRRYYDVIHAQLKEIDATLSGFLRGQSIVCLILGSFYSIGLTAVGLKYGAAIGVTAGILTFIPYVGTGFGWISSVILAFGQFDNDLPRIGMVVAVFAVGHALEAYVLTPRLVGHRVGLHPVWILFALITGAKLLGFTGVLIAVPTAAVLGVLTRFAIRQYKSSAVYKDAL